MLRTHVRLYVYLFCVPYVRYVYLMYIYVYFVRCVYVYSFERDFSVLTIWGLEER